MSVSKALLQLSLSSLAFGCGDPPPGNPPTPARSASPTQRAPVKASAPPEGALKRWSFDDLPAGALPEFALLETASAGTPAVWGLAKDVGAPSGKVAFGVLETRNRGQTYNLALAPGFEAADVDLSVAVRARSGEQDQGGGVAFRADGPGNYYIARWNPLEKNVRFYVVVHEQRSAFAAADVDIDPTSWHTLRVLAERDRFELFMDGTSVLVAKDGTLEGAGRVGLWTKADAATVFDDLTAQTL